MSASHMAMAGVRVMRPMMAIGTAAAIAMANETAPRGVNQNHFKELQQTLLKDGCLIPDVRNEDTLDLALKAKASHPAINDGWNYETRPGGWSAPWTAEEPIGLTLAEPSTVACIHVSLADRKNSAEFSVEALVNGECEVLIHSPGTSKQRRYVYNVKPVETDRLRFRLIKSSAPVAITEVRVYSKPGQETKVTPPEPVSYPPMMPSN